MHTVDILLKAGDIDLQINRFRLWLKSHSVKPASFGYRESGTGVVVQVEFDTEEDATAFSLRFDGVCRKTKALSETGA